MPAEGEATSKQEEEEKQRSRLSGMFSFMKKTKHLRHGTQEGIYLSELNADDPEVAELYFPYHYLTTTSQEDCDVPREDDTESGNGPSIPHSPSSQSPPLITSEWNSQQPKYVNFFYSTIL